MSVSKKYVDFSVNVLYVKKYFKSFIQKIYQPEYFLRLYIIFNVFD